MPNRLSYRLGRPKNKAPSGWVRWVPPIVTSPKRARRVDGASTTWIGRAPSPKECGAVDSYPR